MSEQEEATQKAWASLAHPCKWESEKRLAEIFACGFNIGIDWHDQQVAEKAKELLARHNEAIVDFDEDALRGLGVDAFTLLRQLAGEEP